MRSLYTRQYWRRCFSTVPSRGDHVTVAMSGGIDSSVSAKLLLDQGMSVSGVFMRNWDTSDESGSDKDGCKWKADWNDVQKVCKILNIPCRLVDLSREYWNRIFLPSLNIWESGQTPNPDVWCNRYEPLFFTQCSLNINLRRMQRDKIWCFI